jgi:hypothetical protein
MKWHSLPTPSRQEGNHSYPQAVPPRDPVATSLG